MQVRVSIWNQCQNCNSLDPDDAACRYKPSHLELYWLHRYLLWSDRLKGLTFLCKMDSSTFHLRTGPFPILEAQVGQKSLTWNWPIMICYIVSWWPSCLSDPIAFSNSESDVVWRVSRLPPWRHHGYCSWTMPPMKFRLNLTYCLGGDVVWRISSWRTLEQMVFNNSELA